MGMELQGVEEERDLIITYMTYIGNLVFSQSLLLNNPTNQMKLLKVDERTSRFSVR